MREMKDSGVAWLGLIPQTWEMQRVKHCFYRKNEKAMQDNPVILSLARSGVKVRDISNNEGQLAESYYNYNPVDIDDLLLNPMDLYSGANCSISKVKGVISPAYVNLRALEGINPVFYDYYFKVQYWLMAFFSYGKGVSFDNRWTLNAETLMNYPLIVPSYAEQCRIADYLDEKCSKIDTIIEKQEKIIEKLKEYRIATITDVVTHGIHNERLIKDSGVSFIGDIPESWIVTKLKYMTDAIGDGIHSTPVYDETGKIYFVNGNNIGKDYIEFKENTNTINDLEYSHYKKPLMTENTILITLNGATYGKTSFYHNEKILLGKSAGYITLKKGENKEYVRYYLQSSIARLIMDLSLLGSTIANLSLRTLNDFDIIYPPLQEQQEIVIHLKKTCERIDKQIIRREQLIDKLTEYKKSLIYECVTGKKEVC